MRIRKQKIINGEKYLHCSKCNQFKKLDEFGVDKKAKTGRNSHCKSCHKNYLKKHPNKNREAVNKYNRKNRELCLQRNRQWRLNNPEKAKIASRNWYKRKKNKITECLCNRLYESLNKNFDRKKLWEILGYTYQEFTKYIEKRFQLGMTWDNHGEWEIDHIIPISFFCFQSPEDVEFKMCWRLENIQPLWKHQNKQKGNRIRIA